MNDKRSGRDHLGEGEGKEGPPNSFVLLFTPFSHFPLLSLSLPPPLLPPKADRWMPVPIPRFPWLRSGQKTRTIERSGSFVVGG